MQCAVPRRNLRVVIAIVAHYDTLVFSRLKAFDTHNQIRRSCQTENHNLARQTPDGCRAQTGHRKLLKITLRLPRES